jgi:hypothetical protein
MDDNGPMSMVGATAPRTEQFSILETMKNQPLIQAMNQF